MVATALPSLISIIGRPPGLVVVGTASLAQGRAPTLPPSYSTGRNRTGMNGELGLPGARASGLFYNRAHFALPMTRACVISSLASERKQDCNSRSTLRRAHRSSFLLVVMASTFCPAQPARQPVNGAFLSIGSAL